jgi:hypothetical protein
MKTGGWKGFVIKNRYLVFAVLCFLVGGVLAMMSLIQKVSLFLGVGGIVILTGAMFYFCLKLVTERSYRDYYEDSYRIEHETIEEEIKKSVTYHRYQEAVLNRYESACRDIGMSKEQSEWLLMLLMDEKKKTDLEMKEKGIHI